MHTRGPWTVDFDDIGNGSCQWRIAGGDHDTVADSPVGPHAFDKDNARLIASAPKMLEAMEAVAHLNQWRHRSPEWLENPSCRVELCAAIDNAEFAIRVAKEE